jgi:hypothetical protein
MPIHSDALTPNTSIQKVCRTDAMDYPHVNIKHITKNGVTYALDVHVAAKVTLK